MIEVTTEEFYTLCITIAACTWLIQSPILKQSKLKKNSKKRNRSSKQFTQKQWTPNGWYFDNEKQRWIAPDYPKKDNREEGRKNEFS